MDDKIKEEVIDQELNDLEEVQKQEELTDEEKKEIYIQQLKESKKRFNPLKHPTKTIGTNTVVSLIGRERQVKEKVVLTNVTENKFGASYKQKRKKKTAMTKVSRKNNRRKK